jgi:hypothetical protein
VLEYNLFIMDEQNNKKQRTILRQPAEETVDLYPGLCVCDDRVSGSITVARSRLPLWAFISIVIEDGWEEAVSEENGWSYMEEDYKWTNRKMSDFLYYLSESRGEFARLLLLMAEVERVGRESNALRWYEEEGLRRRMKEQLQRCLEALQD